MIQVDIANSAGTSTISFNTGVADANGTKWWVTDLEGWDLPTPRQKFLSKVQDHGEVVGESFLGPRALTLAGLVQVTSVAQWWASQHQLKNLLTADLVGGINFGVITVHETPVSRFASFKLAGRPKIVLEPSWKFAVPLTCPDPHLYLTDGSDAGVGSF